MIDAYQPLPEKAFHHLLTTTFAVMEHVGERVFFAHKPQDERRPCLVLTRVSTLFGRTFKTNPGYARGRIQINAFAPSYPEVKALAEAVKSVIDNFSGHAGGIDFDFIEIDDEHDLAVMPAAGRETPLTYAVSLDARFMHQQSQ
ncbi:MAG: DUF3168 domain-containing protein [Planctomycetota bacterium]